MMVTINVPRNKLNPMFLFGFFISPAIKVTLFHASLLKIDPTIALAIAPIIAIPITGFQVIISVPFDVVWSDDFIVLHASVQLLLHISALAATKPKSIKPNNASNFAEVKI